MRRRWMILTAALAAVVVPLGASGAPRSFVEDVTMLLSVPECGISIAGTRCETTLSISGGTALADPCTIVKQGMFAYRCSIAKFDQSGPGVVAVAIEGSCDAPSIRYEPAAGRAPLDVRLHNKIGAARYWSLQGLEIFLTAYRHDSEGDHWRFSQEPGRRSWAYFLGSAAGTLWLAGEVTSSGSNCAAGVGAMTLVAHHTAVIAAEDLP